MSCAKFLAQDIVWVRLLHVLTGFRGIIGPSGPFTPRFGMISWDYWTFGSVYPTISGVFVWIFVLEISFQREKTSKRGIFSQMRRR